MKMNRFSLTDSDTVHLTFNGNSKENDCSVKILTVENEPQIITKQNKLMILSETVKSVDALKIFLEERLNSYLT
jgi:hypothetical protein